jgi:hypothetical protein
MLKIFNRVQQAFPLSIRWLTSMHHYVPKARRELRKINPNPSLPGPKHIAFPDHGHRELQVRGAV